MLDVATGDVGLLDVDITGPNVPKMMGKNVFLPPSAASDQGIMPILGPLNMKIMSMGFLLKDPDTPVIWRGPIKMGAIRQFITDVNWGDLDKHFRLMADIDLSGITVTSFNIIGYYVRENSPDNKPFTGVFDGNGHTISNFSYSTGTNYIGVFGYVCGENA